MRGCAALLLMRAGLSWPSVSGSLERCCAWKLTLQATDWKSFVRQGQGLGTRLFTSADGVSPVADQIVCPRKLTDVGSPG